MKKNLKIKYKSKMDKLITRYLVPLMLVIVFITIFVGLIILIGYDFGTGLYNIKRLSICIPLFVILFTLLCSRIGYLWINFIRSIEDNRPISKHHYSPDIMLDHIADKADSDPIKINVMTLNTVNNNDRTYPEVAIKPIVNTTYSVEQEKQEESDVEKLSVNGVPISDDNE